MTCGALLLAAELAILPADRMVMADRLFNRGKYADAEVEYRALRGAVGVAADEVLFRLAECARVLGRNEEARRDYNELAEKYPDSTHADRSRFLAAMGAPPAERHRLLAELDSDRVDQEIRIAALYHLGSEKSDTALLEKCVKLDPKGRYAPYANLKYGSILSESSDAATRRRGVDILMSVACGKDEFAGEALYLAAVQCYREKRYDESGRLFGRYLKNFPTGKNAEDARMLSAWSDFLGGRYADAARTCGAGETDDLSYVKAACAYATGDTARALTLFRKYLEDFPNGRYRADAELPIARIEFEEAQKGNDAAKAVETAKRGFALSKLGGDHLRLAWAYEKAGKAEEAQAEYDKIAKTYPATELSAEALYRKAMICVRNEKWAAAELALAESLAVGDACKFRALCFYWRGVAAIKIGHASEGAEFLAKALEARLPLDEQREAQLMIADIDWQEGRVEKAKRAYIELVKNGACARMTASRIHLVGRLAGGETALICAKALIAQESAEWRQAGYALLGETEEKREAYAAAIDAYRRCLTEKAHTEDMASASLRLGLLESRAGELDNSDKSLKTAISLNQSRPAVRAEAYETLAENAGRRGDWKSARAYATVVVSLFGDGEPVERAKKLLADHPEAQE